MESTPTQIKYEDNKYIVYYSDNNKKEYNTYEEAEISFYIWEINTYGKYAPHYKDIKTRYPRLAWAAINNIQISNNPKRVKAILAKLNDDPHCPCRIQKTSDTICMCKEFRHQESGDCHCGLYHKPANKDNNIEL